MWSSALPQSWAAWLTDSSKSKLVTFNKMIPTWTLKQFLALIFPPVHTGNWEIPSLPNAITVSVMGDRIHRSACVQSLLEVNIRVLKYGWLTGSSAQLKETWALKYCNFWCYYFLLHIFFLYVSNKHNAVFFCCVHPCTIDVEVLAAGWGTSPVSPNDVWRTLQRNVLRHFACYHNTFSFLV